MRSGGSRGEGLPADVRVGGGAGWCRVSPAMVAPGVCGAASDTGTGEAAARVGGGGGAGCVLP